MKPEKDLGVTKLREVEKTEIEYCLSVMPNKTKAARLLGIDRQTLIRKIAAHGITEPEWRTHFYSKLSEDAVREIRAKHSNGIRVGVLARKFHVTPQSITAIVSGRVWKHLLPKKDVAA